MRAPCAPGWLTPTNGDSTSALQMDQMQPPCHCPEHRKETKRFPIDEAQLTAKRQTAKRRPRLDGIGWPVGRLERPKNDHHRSICGWVRISPAVIGGNFGTAVDGPDSATPVSTVASGEGAVPACAATQLQCHRWEAMVSVEPSMLQTEHEKSDADPIWERSPGIPLRLGDASFGE